MIRNKQQNRLYDISISPINNKRIFWDIAHLLIIIFLIVIFRKEVVNYTEDTRCHKCWIGVILLTHHKRISRYILVTCELWEPRMFQNLRNASPMSTTDRTIVTHSTIMLGSVFIVMKQKYWSSDISLFYYYRSNNAPKAIHL